MIANALKKSLGINYPGLIAAWSAKGKTNDDEDRAILKDLTGNGHDITLNGFAFSEMSGYGGYNYNFTRNFLDTIKPTIKKDFIFEVNGYPKNRCVLEKNYRADTTLPLIIKSLKIKVTIENNTTNAPISFYTTGGDAGTDQSIQITTSGVYEIKEYTVNSITGLYGVYIGFVFNNENIVSLENPDYYCKIELLPEYPDALVFDGVDDYGINEDMPILTDFTVIAKRKFINNGKGALLSKADDTKSAFVFEGGDLFQTKIWSFGGGNNIDVISDDISYMTTRSYNGISLYKGTIKDTNKIFLGRYRYWQGAFYSAYLFDRSLDEQEIKEFIRKYIDPEYLLPSEQTTE